MLQEVLAATAIGKQRDLLSPKGKARSMKKLESGGKKKRTRGNSGKKSMHSDDSNTLEQKRSQFVRMESVKKLQE